MTSMACTAAFALLMAAGAAAQLPVGKGVKDRGQTAVEDETQTPDRGRLDKQYPVSRDPIALHGILVDAGCVDRSSLNLRRPATPPALAAPMGIPVEAAPSAGLADEARADAIEHQVPDLVTRQDDPSCAVTGLTSGFAILTDKGRLLNLDEGGNTMAIQAMQANVAGRALLNGKGPAIKPRVMVTGHIRGDRMLASKLSVE